MLKNIAIIVGDENTNKIALLKRLQKEFGLTIPKRVTTDENFREHSSLYDVVSDKDMNRLVSKTDTIRTIGYTGNGISAYTSLTIASNIADLYNGDIQGIVLNATEHELSYYLEKYKTATIIGYASKNSEKYQEYKQTLDEVIAYGSEDEIVEKLPIYDKKEVSMILK